MVPYWLPKVKVVLLVLLSLIWGMIVFAFTSHIFEALFIFAIALVIHLIATPKL